MNRTTDMTTGKPARHILRFALPLIVTNIGQQLYMIADAAIVGRGVGVKALAAVGATDWCYWLILWTVMGLTQGFSTFVSRRFGERNYQSMNRTIAMSTLLCAGIGALLTALGLFAARPLLNLLHTPEDIIGGSSLYLRTMIAGTPIVMAYNMAAAILRAFGDGRTPLIAMVIAALMNIGLDVLFVFGFRMGILGAAVASVLSQLVSFLYCLKCLRRVDCIRLDGQAWKIDGKLIRDLIVFGVPIALRFIVIALGGVVLQSSINLQGSIFIAGYTATNKVYGLLESSATSLGLACSTFFAQNYGAGLHERVKAGVRSAIGIVCAMAAVVTLFVLCTRQYLLQLFLDVNETNGPAALEIAVRYLTIMACCLIVLYLVHVFQNALQAMGISLWSMCSGFAEGIARVFMAKAAIHWIGRDALFFSEPVAWLGALLLVMLPYLFSRRKLLNGVAVEPSDGAARPSPSERSARGTE